VIGRSHPDPAESAPNVAEVRAIQHRRSSENLTSGAARTRQAGLVAACPAPAAGIFGATRTTLRMSLPHLLRPRSWTKPWRLPTFEQFRRWIANTQTEDIAREMYDGLVCESGRYLWELLLAVPRLSKAAVVDFAAVTAAVLVMGAECDRIVSAGIVRRTQPGTSTGPPLRFPTLTTWCFQGRRHR
jgi:hypothetical protein